MIVPPTDRSPTDRPPTARAEVRPAILTVDDDPSVSRAVARDLRRRYGQEHRIVRADSGADALTALKEMKLRGTRWRYCSPTTGCHR